MDSHVYTPNTKLRIETAVLGPYAAKLNFLGGKGVNKVSFNSTTTKSGAVNSKTEPKEKVFAAFHKKQGTALLQDSDGRRQTRLSVVQSRQKDKRFETLMEKRIQQAGSSTAFSMADVQAAVKNKNVEVNILKNSKSGFGTNNNTINTTNSRREQLLKWKDQKNVATNLSQKNGNPSTVYQVRGQNIPNKNMIPKPKPPVCSNIPKRPPTGLLVGNNPIPASFLLSNQAKGGNAGSGGERRVTRAMSKAQTTTKTAPYPPIAKMKHLSLIADGEEVPINVKKSTAPVSNKVPLASSKRATKASNTKAAILEEEETMIIPIACLKEKSSSVDVSMEPMQPQQSLSRFVTVGVQAPTPGRNIQTPPPPPKPKAKPKGMQFDEVYVEYNKFFLEAGTALMHESGYLKKIVEAAVNIPEDVLCDIESTLGQAKLLMDSKLPQFGQLLYFYLSKENNPGPILPCDLQGWWDVASISVEKVKARFSDLKALKECGWKKPEPLVSQKVKEPLKSMKKSALNKPSDNSSVSESNSLASKKTKPTKAKTSSSFREFLANKRKNVNQVPIEEAPTPLKGETKVSTRGSTTLATPKPKSSDPIVSSHSSPTPQRKFEGGFFNVSSPLRSTKPNVFTPDQKILLRTNALTTPGSRRNPPRRSSLVTLAVRKSMGSMFKTGAGGQLTETEGVNNKMEGDNDKTLEQQWNPQPMDNVDGGGQCKSTKSYYCEDTTAHLPEVIAAPCCPEEPPAWSPFSYDQISIFNNSLIGSQLQLLYSDWPKELVMIDEDDELVSRVTRQEEQDQHHHQRMNGVVEDELLTRTINQEERYYQKRKGLVEKQKDFSSSTYVSFLGRPLQSDIGRSYYCEIFGAQNVMDLHPEFSPFDNTIDIEQSLVEKHFTLGDVTLRQEPEDINNNHFSHNFEESAFRTTTPPVTTTVCNSHLGFGTTEGLEREVILNDDDLESFGSSSTTDIFDEPEFSLSRSIQCKVCDIYQSMKSRRKLSKYTGVNISVECTNCGRFTDITPRRRETRASEKFPLLPNSSSQPSSDEHFQNENGSD